VLPPVALVMVLLGAAPLFAVSTPQEVRIPSVTPRSAPPPARFSHWRHNSQHCYTCHPSIFPQALEGFTHAQMQAGQYCGACHDGQTAKAISGQKCEVCHESR